jgi:hypothetical protein
MVNSKIIYFTFYIILNAVIVKIRTDNSFIDLIRFKRSFDENNIVSPVGDEESESNAQNSGQKLTVSKKSKRELNETKYEDSGDSKLQSSEDVNKELNTTQNIADISFKTNEVTKVDSNATTKPEISEKDWSDFQIRAAKYLNVSNTNSTLKMNETKVDLLTTLKPEMNASVSETLETNDENEETVNSSLIFKNISTTEEIREEQKEETETENFHKLQEPQENKDNSEADELDENIKTFKKLQNLEEEMKPRKRPSSRKSKRPEDEDENEDENGPDSDLKEAMRMIND